MKKLLHEWIGIQPWQWCPVLGFTKVTHLCGQPKIYQCQFVLAFFVFGWRRGTSKGKKWAPASSGPWHSAWKLRVFWLTFLRRPYKDCKFQSSFGSIVREKLFNPLECYGDPIFGNTLCCTPFNSRRGTLIVHHCWIYCCCWGRCRNICFKKNPLQNVTMFRRLGGRLFCICWYLVTQGMVRFMSAYAPRGGYLRRFKRGTHN